SSPQAHLPTSSPPNALPKPSTAASTSAKSTTDTGSKSSPKPGSTSSADPPDPTDPLQSPRYERQNHRHTFRPKPHWLAAHRRRSHRYVQLGSRPTVRRPIHPPHGRHRSR